MNVTRRIHILNKILILMFCFYSTGSENELIYILSWHGIKALDKTTGQQYFINQNCKYQNCYLTYNRTLFDDIIKFDVILFNSFEVYDNIPEKVIPPARSQEQKYIFMSSESPDLFPIKSLYNGFFNYTFTYKLDSDIPKLFFAVRNRSDNKVIAPKVNVQWIHTNDMEPINQEIESKLKYKNKAAVWLASHCKTPSRREDIIAKLITELERYNLSIETTGTWQCVGPYENHTSPCSYWNNPNGTYSPEVCHSWITANHYFYLAFENSMSEDYVTEKILTATKNFAIPIVFGGADYSKFVSLNYIYLHIF